MASIEADKTRRLQELTRRLFSALRHSPFHPQWLMGSQPALDGLAQVRGILLDVGAADRWLESTIPQGCRYIALDYPKTGQEKYASKPEIFASVESLPFQSQSIDALVCLEVIEHVYSPRSAFEEIARVLKPDGMAWISIPFLYPLHDVPFDYQRLTEFGLRREVHSVGLELIGFKQWMTAIETAGLIANLAIAGPILKARWWQRILLLPLAVPTIFAVNLLASLGARCWPNWENITMGHQITVKKQ